MISVDKNNEALIPEGDQSVERAHRQCGNDPVFTADKYGAYAAFHTVGTLRSKSLEPM